MYRIKLPVASFFKVMLLVWLAFAQLFILAKIKKIILSIKALNKNTRIMLTTIYRVDP